MVIGLHRSFKDLGQIREISKEIAEDPLDLRMFDFFRVLCLIWILCFGTCQFTMSGTAYNPWSLQDYF